MKVSVVIPAYNEADTLSLLRERLTRVMDSLPDHDFEVVLVDDHSTDATPDLIHDWAHDDPRIRGLRFSRNFGSHAAFTAGLTECTGDCAALIAADLQDPPELLERLIAEWHDGHEVVWGVRARRQGESWKTLLFSRVYWAVVRTFALAETPKEGADSVLLDRRVIDAFTAIGEKNTSLLSLLMWIGFRQTRIRYVKGERAGGVSGWTLSKRLKLAIDSVVSFSSVPIRVTWLAGLLFLTAAGLWAVLAVVGASLGIVRVAPIASVMLGVMLLGFGVLLSCAGAIGEYVWRAYDESRDRPRYIIERRMGQMASPAPAHSRHRCRCGGEPNGSRPLSVPASMHIT